MTDQSRPIHLFDLEDRIPERHLLRRLNPIVTDVLDVIVDVEATPARTCDEVAATKTMIMRTERRLGLKPARPMADTEYGTGKFLAFVLGERIAPHSPVRDPSTREDGSIADFFNGIDPMRQ